MTLASSPVAAVETATAAATGLWGEGSQLAAVIPKIVAVLIAVSGVGSSNVTVMTGGRYLFAVSRGTFYFVARARRTHPGRSKRAGVAAAGEIPSCCSRLSRYQTPHVALWAQATWAILLLVQQLYCPPKPPCITCNAAPVGKSFDANHLAQFL